MARTADEIIRVAFERARGRSALVHRTGGTPVGYAVYSVGSSTDPDSAYRVTVSPDEQYASVCPSEIRPACWHRCAVHIRRVNDRLRAEHEARVATA
jgi:hypothetical protein